MLLEGSALVRLSTPYGEDRRQVLYSGGACKSHTLLSKESEVDTRKEGNGCTRQVVFSWAYWYDVSRPWSCASRLLTVGRCGRLCSPFFCGRPTGCRLQRVQHAVHGVRRSQRQLHAAGVQSQGAFRYPGSSLSLGFISRGSLIGRRSFSFIRWRSRYREAGWSSKERSTGVLVWGESLGHWSRPRLRNWTVVESWTLYIYI